MATPADIGEIVRLKALIIASSYPAGTRTDLDAHPEWPARASAAIADMMGLEAHEFFVATTADGTVAGCIGVTLLRYVPGLSWGARHAYVSDMCTDEPYRGLGVGRLLMHAALDWARERETESVRLDATPSAIPVYERLGFERQGGDELFPTMMLWFDEG